MILRFHFEAGPLGVISFHKRVQILLQRDHRLMKSFAQGWREEFPLQNMKKLFAERVRILGGRIKMLVLNVPGDQQSFKWMNGGQTIIFVGLRRINTLDNNAIVIEKWQDSTLEEVRRVHGVPRGMYFRECHPAIGVHGCFHIDITSTGVIPDILDRAEEK